MWGRFGRDDRAKPQEYSRYLEDFATKERSKMARRWDARTGVILSRALSPRVTELGQPPFAALESGAGWLVGGARGGPDINRYHRGNRNNGPIRFYEAGHAVYGTRVLESLPR
jgi:hypothetical protein